MILDAETGQIADVNPFLIEMLGYSHETFLGKKLWEIGLFKDVAASQQGFSTLQKHGYIRYEDLPLETRDGCKIQVEFVSNVYEVIAVQISQKVDIVVVILLSFWTSFYEFRNQVYHYNMLS